MSGAVINNEFYKDLGERWYTAEGDAVALLRLEKKVTTPWVIEHVRARFQHARILDVGCGGGLLTFALAEQGWICTGLDRSDEVLQVGRARDPQQQIQWVQGRAEQLPFPDACFDVVCLMDVLEHVEDPQKSLAEARRVLAPGGILLFHTFNRTLLSWLFAAKGLDWFIKDSQNHIHDWRLFIKPKELRGWLQDLGLVVESLEGINPKVLSTAFWRLVFTRRVPADFEFQRGGAMRVGYLGCAHL